MEDEQKLTLTGRIEHITFFNEANGYTVLELETANEIVTVVGIMPHLAEGESLSVMGQWVFNQKYGKQFSAESAECFFPRTQDDMFNYLASGDIKGIRAKTAKKIIDAFGENAFDVLENQPELLAKIPGISTNTAKRMSLEYKERFGVREIIMKFRKYGLGNNEAIKIYKQFGSSAINRVEKNPYILCNDCGFSFDAADELAENVGSFNMEDRISAGIRYVLRHNALSNGHTCLPREKLVPLVADFLGYSRDDVDIHLDLATTKREFTSKLLDKTEYIFINSLFECENSIAKKLLSRISLSFYAGEDLSKSIALLEEKENIKYHPLQVEAIENAVNRGMLVLTGGPGTGKTTTLKAIISLLEGREDNIILCAPTGKAAKRMEEVCGHPAKTIHRLLEAQISDGFTIFNRDENNKLECDTIIVDEMSMVDVHLFSALCNALPLSSRLILVGDSDQLPSVGPGAVLSDIINSGKVPTIELNTIFRQAEESLIVTNAHRIISGEPPLLDSTDNDFFFLPTKNKYDTLSLVSQLYCERLPKSYKNQNKEIQILCPSRIGEEGSVNINQMLQNIINPPASDKKELTVSPFILREGDRIMQIKNDYDVPYILDNQEEGLGIFNGEIGFIKSISFSKEEITVRFDDKTANYSFEQIRNTELAYAMTIHKSQGSEYDCVIIPVFDIPEKLCYRNLLYTGVTRAKSRLILTGRQNTIMKMAENDRKNLRYTALEKLML